MFVSNEVAGYLAGATYLAVTLFYVCKVAASFMGHKEAVITTALTILSYYIVNNFVFEYSQKSMSKLIL